MDIIHEGDVTETNLSGRATCGFGGNGCDWRYNLENCTTVGLHGQPDRCYFPYWF